MTPTIIFLHIPKAAGTTLHRIIEHQYPLAETHSFGADAQGSLAEFKEWSEAKRSKIRILKGHMAFGVHQLFPQSTTYITFLRDPIERVISYYYYVLHTPEHYLHGEIVAQNLSLENTLENRLTSDLDNGQVRLLSGIWDDVPVGHCTRQMLNQAKENLKNHFCVVGLAEQFDASLLLLQYAFKWRHIYYQKQNVSQSRPVLATLSPQALATIKRYNSLDLELYTYAQELFQAQLDRQKVTFHLQLKLFPLRNWFYNDIYRRHLHPRLHHIRQIRR